MSTRIRRFLAATTLTLAVAGVPTAASAATTSTTVVSSSSRLCLSNQENIGVAPGIVLCGGYVLNTSRD